MVMHAAAKTFHAADTRGASRSDQAHRGQMTSLRGQMTVLPGLGMTILLRVL